MNAQGRAVIPLLAIAIAVIAGSVVNRYAATEAQDVSPVGSEVPLRDIGGRDIGVVTVAGTIIGALLGFEFEEGQSGESMEGIQGHAFGLSQMEMQELAASLKPGNSAGFLLVEHVWARDLKGAIRDAGGFPLGEGFLTPEALAEVATELVAMSEAIEELEAEEAGAGA